MLSSQFIRDKARVDRAYKVSGKVAFAMEHLRVHIPERFVERNLAVIGDVVYILGCMAIITDDNRFASSRVTAMIRTEPDQINKVVVDDVQYIELSYNKGSCLLASTDVEISDNLAHRIYTEFLGKGRQPWYYNYEIMPKIFSRTDKYNGLTLGADPVILEIMTANMCRDPDDPSKFYRQRPDAKLTYLKDPPAVVPLRNVSYSATNVAAKLGGSRFDEGLTAILVNPSERPERIETMLR